MCVRRVIPEAPPGYSSPSPATLTHSTDSPELPHEHERSASLHPARIAVSWTARLDAKDAQDYDAFVDSSPAGHYAQTRAWGDVERAAGRVATSFAVVREAGTLVGAAMILRPRLAGVGLPWAWVERGPVVARASDLGRAVRAIARAAPRRGVFRLGVMPYWADADAETAEAQLLAAGCRDVQKPAGAHACTLRIDIGAKPDRDLFAGAARQQVRWRAAQAEKAGARARPGASEDWGRLRAMHGTLMESQGRRDKPLAFWLALERHVGESAEPGRPGRRGALFVCEHRGRVVAASVVLLHGGRATYAWGASVADKLPFSKAVPALVAGVRWARDAGCSSFDLGGVPIDGDDDPKRAAIAMFKYDFDRRRVRLVRQHAVLCT
jgi:Acetyltransferase (GNAT) domain/FemAB family